MKDDFHGVIYHNFRTYWWIIVS